MENLENKANKQSNIPQEHLNEKGALEDHQSPLIEDSDMVEEAHIEEEIFPPLEILYQDNHYIAVIKPYGLLVHRTTFVDDKRRFALQKLRNQIKKWIYPIHRLDGPTTGVLVFGLHKKAASKLSDLFRKRNMKKTYYALVRGHAPEKGIIEEPIQKHPKAYPQKAKSEYVTVAKGILPIAQFGYEQLYYSLVRVRPYTGRMHQIRKHLKHINCPIICDRRYGDWRHNKLFNVQFEMKNLFLVAKKLEFLHPYTQEAIEIEAPFSDDMLKMAERFGWDMDELEKREHEGYYDNIETKPEKTEENE